MNDFFLASGLIFAISIIILAYYWIKQVYKHKQGNKLKKLIRQKYYINEKEYLRNYLSHHIPLLINNDIQWILIWSKFNSEYKFELTYNQVASEIIIKTNKIENITNYKSGLLNLGLKEFETCYENSIFKINQNAKMITDVLYFIYEKIHNLKNFSNHKLMTSST